uniref:Uncharacterized protein n=1 Tax=Ditylenchus dipsaci TaxID=166011 RepID=A0A915EFQ4_9BILA
MSISKVVLLTVALIGISCALIAVPPVPVPTNVAGVPGVSGLVALIQSLVVLLLSVLSILTQVPLPAVLGLIPVGLVNTIPTDLNAIIAALPIVGGFNCHQSIVGELAASLDCCSAFPAFHPAASPLPALTGIIPTGLVGTIPATLDAVIKSLPIVGGLLGGGGLSNLPILGGLLRAL